MKAKKILFAFVFSLVLILALSSCDISLGGERPLSAYDLALENGFEGSYQDWQNSLVGEKGSDGKSAYDLALENGFEGSYEEWQESLNGVDGKDAYDMAVESGFEGTLEEWLQSLGGVGIASVDVNKSGNLIVTLTNNTTHDLGKAATACKHQYAAYEKGMDATCASMGFETRKCTLCGFLDYRFTAAVGHTFGEAVSIPQGGKTLLISTCASCGLSKMEVETPKYSEGLEYELTEDENAYRVEGLGSCTDTEIVIPEEYMGVPVTEIADRAFYNCATIVSVSLPLSITKIGDKAFSDCPELQNIELPDKIEIGIDVFRGSINVELIYTHELLHVPAVAPTCTTSGNIEYYYCEPCNEYYADSEGKERLYEVLLPKAHNFVDGWCACGQYQDNVMIVSVDSIANLGLFPLGTLEDAIGLPESVNVYTADGVAHVLPIVWDVTGYTKNVVGDYTIKGHIQADEFYFADESLKTVSTGVSIVDYMVGTADIVFLLDVSGSMEDEVNNVKNNIETFAQLIADQGVSARWSAITYSDFSDCAGDPREETKTLLNGTSDWFTDVASYKNAIAGFTLAYGGDSPEVAIDAILHADTLSTRADARVFYILLTDDTYKMANHYGVETIEEVVEKLNDKNVNASVITTTAHYDTYDFLTSSTGGIKANIYDNFAQTLFDSLVPIIYERVEE